MPLLKSPPKPTPGKIYAACLSFVTADRVVRAEEELDGADPIVASHFQWFVPLGTPRETWPTPFDGAVALADKQAAEAEADLVVARVDVTERVTVVQAGERRHKNDAVVKANPRSFEKVRT